jgi:hypothetical protein
MTYIQGLPTLLGQIVREYKAPVVTENTSKVSNKIYIAGAVLVLLVIITVAVLIKIRLRRKRYHAQGRSS